jgi:iron(III) transport system ATP-binding protein
MNLLSLEGIDKSYGPVRALRDLRMQVAAGSRTAIVGPSGSGKSTLLRIIAGFDAADAGRVILDGEVLAEGPAAIPAHRRSIGFVSQDGSLFPHLSVAGNIAFGLPRATPARADKVAALLEMVELDRSLLERRPHELSGGQQQRVALARALARRPRLMLLDEPFSALDTGLRLSMRKMLAELLDRAGITALLVTHDQAEALSFADRIAVLNGGRVAQFGSPQELYFRPTDPFTASFLGVANIWPATLGEGWADCPLGRVPVETHGRTGAGTIMLRPEQIGLTPAGPANGSAAPLAPTGTVTSVEFGGPNAEVGVELDPWNGTGAPTRIIAHAPGASPLVPGAHVGLALAGRAHLFPA